MSISRRDFFQRAGSGFGMLALHQLLRGDGLLASPPPPSGQRPQGGPLSPRPPHHAPRAKSVIWIFANGGPSHVDTFDYKPELIKRDGQELPGFDRYTGFFSQAVGPLMKSPFPFKQHGECGKWVSSLFPHTARHVDKMAFIHSGWTESNNHSPALFMMNCGLPRMGLPCFGSWLTYGLGSMSSDLPAFVVMSDPKGRGLPKGHASNWGSGFLPSVYQGTWLRPRGDAIPNLRRPSALTDADQRRQLDLLAKLNGMHQDEHPNVRDLAARIDTYELAYRMQTAAPEAFDVKSEPEHIKTLYGLDQPHCTHFAAQCMTARRMVERGVRMVQIYSGGMANQLSWDGHADIHGNHTGFARETDQPVAALLTDLHQRGLLDDTLVIWGGEFGRLPVAQKGKKPGRDHNPHAFTTWLAGGGARGGTSYGATDPVGHKAVHDRVHVNDLHATILHLLGLDHEALTYRHTGRDFRLTDVAGRVVHDVVA